MPLYDYKCADCSHRFELLVGQTMEGPKMLCPSCGSRNIKRILSTFSVSSGQGSPSSGNDFGGSCTGGTCPTCPVV